MSWVQGLHRLDRSLEKLRICSRDQAERKTSGNELEAMARAWKTTKGSCKRECLLRPWLKKGNKKFECVGKCIRETRGKIPKSMNTYRLESRKPFHAEIVYKILKEIVKQECQGIVYDPVKCSELVTSLSDKIRNKIKLLEFERYRLVIVVEMGEKKLQGLQLVAKCLWDATRDNFATYTYQNTTLFVNATCFGIYQD